MEKPTKYYINRKTYDAYGATPRMCVLDAVHFLEFNSQQREEANFYCFASPKAIAELAMKKADAYGIELSYKQAQTCLKNCKQNGDLVKLFNYSNGSDEPLCPKTTDKIIWATKIRARMSQDKIESLKTKKSNRAPFEERRPELVDIRDRFIGLLGRHDMGVMGKEREIEKQIDIIGKEHGYNTTSLVGMLNEFLAWVDTDWFDMQSEKNKYCPRINKISDISKKFDPIVQFLKTPVRHYDPSKCLTPD